MAGFSYGFRYRKELAQILKNTARRSSVLDLDPHKLQAESVSVLVLDFDGVLSPHGDNIPLDATREWLEKCVAVFGEQNIFILSNRPSEERIQSFSQGFPHIRFINGPRKKPFPDGLIRIGEISGSRPASILMADDRLLTGCLAAILAGARPVYITSPYISFRHRPCAELFFMTLRFSERLFVRILRFFP